MVLEMYSFELDVDFHLTRGVFPTNSTQVLELYVLVKSSLWLLAWHSINADKHNLFILQKNP